VIGIQHPRRVVLLGMLIFLLSGCTRTEDARDARASDTVRSPSPGQTEDPAPTPTWHTPPPPTKAGALEVGGFNDFVRKTEPDWAASPLRSALEYLDLADPLGQSTTIRVQYPSTEGGSPAVVTITKDRLPDDSIQTARVVMTFRASGNRWRLVSASVTRRCWPGRGHRGFSAETCI
jgi:hypothetical protein